MHATEVIETYIDDTVRLLPRRQRDDVATELRSLLNEELHARAQESGRPPDESLALSLVRGYGRPNEAAARYQPPWAIIDPADSTSFMRAAIIGAGALVLLGAISKRLPSLPGTADNLVKIGILVWLGLLVVAFGAKNWIRRCWPATVLWEPRDRGRANRVGTAVVVPIATFFVVLCGAPTWVLDHIDLYQAHKDDPETPLEETLGAVGDLIRQGKVRAIGASNYLAEWLAEALRVSRAHGLPAYQCLQPYYNLAERRLRAESGADLPRGGPGRHPLLLAGQRVPDREVPLGGGRGRQRPGPGGQEVPE